MIYINASQKKDASTVLILKTPKTKSSIRKVCLPSSVAEMLSNHKKEQESIKEMLGPQYKDHNPVICGPFGNPCEQGTIQSKLDSVPVNEGENHRTANFRNF